MGGAISRIQFTRRSNTPNNQLDQGLSYKKYYYKFWNRGKMVENGNKAMTMMGHDASDHASVRSDRYLLSQATMRSDRGLLSPVSNESNITMSSVSSLPKEDHQQKEVVKKVEYEKKDQLTQMSDKNDDDKWDEDQEEGNSRFSRSPSFKVYVTHINHKIDGSKKSRSDLNIENKPSKSGELQNEEATTSSNRQGDSTKSSNKASVRQRFRRIIPNIVIKTMFGAALGCHKPVHVIN